MQYGGPATVTFEATGPLPVTNGEAVTTARFAQPGTYQLVVSATDRAMTTRVPVTVTVQ
jgi:Flp pilus assembly protein CpaB